MGFIFLVKCRQTCVQKVSSLDFAIPFIMDSQLELARKCADEQSADK